MDRLKQIDAVRPVAHKHVMLYVEGEHWHRFIVDAERGTVTHLKNAHIIEERRVENTEDIDRFICKVLDWNGYEKTRSMGNGCFEIRKGGKSV